MTTDNRRDHPTDNSVEAKFFATAVPHWARRIGLPTLSRCLVAAGLLLRLVLAVLGPAAEPALPLIPLILSCGLALAGIALLSGQWAEPQRTPLWPSIAILAVCTLVVSITGGPNSWYLPVFVLFAMSEAVFQQPRRAWLLSGITVGCLASPLLVDWRPAYLVVLALSTTVIIAGTRWITLARQDMVATLRLASAGKMQGLLTSLDLRDALHGTADLVRELLEPSACVLYLLQPDGERLEPSHVFLDPRAYGPEEREAILSYYPTTDAGILGHVLATRQVELVPDNTADTRMRPIPGLPVRQQTAIIAPLEYAGESLGALRVSRDGVATYSLSDRAVVQALANQAAIAIANARLYRTATHAEEAARVSEDRYERLMDQAGEALVVVDIETLAVEYISRAAQRLLGFDLATLEADPRLLISRLAPEGHAVMRDGLEQLRSGAAVVKDLVAEWRGRDERVMTMLHTLMPVRDGRGRVRAVECLCRDITEQVRIERDNRRLARYDQLTGVHNRLYFEECLRDLASNPGNPVSIILGDLNGLKLVNDAFGHHAGDELLRTTARIILRSVRRQDTVCRWGGDEFAIIVNNDGPRRAQAILERLRAELAAEATAPIPLSVAFGMASCGEASTADLDALLREAEDRMYRNKLLEAKSTQSSIIASLQKTLQEKTHETAAHAYRLQELCALIADELGLSDEVMIDLSLLALLHDIGKVGIPDHVLSNAGTLEPEEWAIMQRHPEIGYRIAAATPSLAHLAEYILTHHERWDGGGYPRGLKGEEIPLVSRILAIADAYDTMTSGRPYREPISPEAALAELARCAGEQFDPRLVRLFRRAVMLGKALALGVRSEVGCVAAADSGLADDGAMGGGEGASPGVALHSQALIPGPTPLRTAPAAPPRDSSHARRLPAAK